MQSGRNQQQIDDTDFAHLVHTLSVSSFIWETGVQHK